MAENTKDTKEAIQKQGNESILTPYIKAGYPVLYLLTNEESRAEKEIACVAQVLERNLFIWSCTEGLSQIGDKGGKKQQVEDPIDALKTIAKDPQEKAIYIFRDMQDFLVKAAPARRYVRDIARDFKQMKKTLILLSPVQQIHPEIERDLTLIDLVLPTTQQLAPMWDKMYGAYQKPIKESVGEVDENEREKVVQASLGLTTIEAENAYAKAIIQAVALGRSSEKADDKKPISHFVMKEKAAAVKKNGILEYFDAAENLANVGGLARLKKWVEIRKGAFTKKARQFGLPMPRGVTFVGLPGCGKSLSAKAISSYLNLPLLRFDIGKVFAGLVGQSEANMRSALQTIDAIGNCVVWVDEMEKAFAGMQGGGVTDSGVSQRVFGTFITWMQEKKGSSFVVATVNRIEGLPPELLRKGRFDEIFFVNLPSEKEREDIFKIHISKDRRPVEERVVGPWPHNPKDFDIKRLVKKSDGCSGAEIEEAVIAGLYESFYTGKKLNTDQIENSLLISTPLSKSNKVQLDAMAEWAKNNAVNASGEEESDNTKLKRELEIDDPPRSSRL